EVFGDAFVIGKSGDPAPGLDNEAIQSFGAPVANPSFPFPFDVQRPPSGIVSVVTLSTGRSALWLWLRTFRGIGIAPPETRVLLLEATTDGQVVRDFSPLKLSDTGSLLLRGTVGEGSAAREGLFLMDGLFDEQPQ